MKIENFATHKIDISTDTIENITHEVIGTDFEPYLKELIQQVSNDANSRNFEFLSETTEIRVLISSMLNGSKFEDYCSGASKRLLTHEKTAQEGIIQMGKEIQKGMIILAIVSKDHQKGFFICKAEHLDFLDENSFKRTRGLPIKKKLFKAFLTTVNTDKSIESVLVYDTNPVMSKYWWQDYLELKPVFTDSHNTKSAFEAIDNKLFQPIKKKHLSDYTCLRNSSVRYFRSKEEFSLEGFIQDILEGYPPIDTDLSIEGLKEKIRAFPEKYKFDNRFTIDKKEVTARQKTTVRLNEHLDLIIKSDIDLANTIIPVEDPDGQKYIKIKSEEGYNAFRTRSQEK